MLGRISEELFEYITTTSHKGGGKVMSIVKEEATKLINKLPDQATWDDIMYEFYVKKKLAVALKADEEGHVISHEEVKKRFLSK